MNKMTLIVGAAALALSPLMAAPALADASAEAGIAATHAGLAAKQTDIAKVHMHMHHALNCLVGPGGEGFDASNANPCAKGGKGAIPDASDATMKAKLTSAEGSLKAGLASNDLTTAQADATKAAASLQ